MKTFLNYCKYIFLACLISASAHAQVFPGLPDATLREVVNAINAVKASVENLFKIDFNNKMKLMYEANPNMPKTVLGNKALSSSVDINNLSIKNLNTYVVPKNLNNRDDKEIQELSLIPASDMPETKQTSLMRLGPNTTTPNLKGNQSLSIESLIGPLAYPDFVAAIDKLQQNPAYNFIRLAGGLYQPVTTISLRNLDPPITDPKELLKIQTSPDYRKLQMAVRSYIAAQSVGANNLYQMMIERIPQENLGLRAGMIDSKGQPIKNASPLELQAYLANRRSENKQWYNQMATASPATVQRETLFVLAEIRQQLFQMQQQNERLLATLSVMQMQQNMQMNKMNLMEAEQKVTPEIRKAQGLSVEPAVQGVEPPSDEH